MALTKRDLQPAAAPTRVSPQLPVGELRLAMLRHIRALRRAARRHVGRHPHHADGLVWSQAIRNYRIMLAGLRIQVQTCSNAAVERLAVEVSVVGNVRESILARYNVLAQ